MEILRLRPREVYLQKRSSVAFTLTMSIYCPLSEVQYQTAVVKGHNPAYFPTILTLTAAD